MTFSGTFENYISLTSFIESAKINPQKPFTISALDHNKNKAIPLEISLDGIASNYGVGGP